MGPTNPICFMLDVLLFLSSPFIQVCTTWIIVLEKLMTLLPITLIYALIVATPAICAVQALVFYRLIERPLSNFLERKTKGWFAANCTATAVPAN